MSIYDGDQQQTTTIIVNGVHTNASATQVKANAPANSVYTFTVGYSHVFGGRLISYRKGQSYVLDAALKAALLALGAPMVAA